MSDDEWALIGPLLPTERGRGCRLAGDNRPYFEGMMWMARTGAQWRHLPDEYGKWNSVFRRYRRWLETGVFDAMLESFAEALERDTTADMIDSTVVRAHHCAVGLKRMARPVGKRFVSDVLSSLRKRIRPFDAGSLAKMESRTGNCYDNAPMESFFHTLKVELVHQCRWATQAEARQALFGYIEGYYNRHRMHSALEYLTPEQAEQSMTG